MLNSQTTLLVGMSGKSMVCGFSKSLQESSGQEMWFVARCGSALGLLWQKCLTAYLSGVVPIRHYGWRHLWVPLAQALLQGAQHHAQVAFEAPQGRKPPEITSPLQDTQESTFKSSRHPSYFGYISQKYHGTKTNFLGKSFCSDSVFFHSLFNENNSKDTNLPKCTQHTYC